MTLIAFGLYGCWAFGVNFSRGWSSALWAGCGQGISSSIATFSISTIIEAFFARLRNRRGGLWLAWLIPSTLTAFLHTTIQWAVGTTDIVLTILPSVVMGYVFAGLYVQTLLRLSLARKPATL